MTASPKTQILTNDGTIALSHGHIFLNATFGDNANICE